MSARVDEKIGTRVCHQDWGRRHRTGIEKCRILKEYGYSSVILTSISRTILKVYCDLLLFPENREIAVNISSFLLLFTFDTHCMYQQHGERSEEGMFKVLKKDLNIQFVSQLHPDSSGSNWFLKRIPNEN